MKPEYIRLGGTIVTLSQIVSVRRSTTDEEGEYAVNLSGTRQVQVSLEEGQALWDWLDKQAITPDQLV